MDKYFGIAAGIITFLSFFPYFRDVINRVAKPERASWFIWIVIGPIAIFSQLALGAGPSIWLVAMDTLGGIIGFILAVIYGSGWLKKRDYIGLAIAGLGLILWQFTHHAAYALITIILIDLVGTVLNTVKTYEDPGSETPTLWLCVAFAGLLAAISVGEFNPVLLIYPLYIFLANISVPIAMLLGRNKKKQ